MEMRKSKFTRIPMGTDFENVINKLTADNYIIKWEVVGKNILDHSVLLVEYSPMVKRNSRSKSFKNRVFTADVKTKKRKK